MNEAQAHRPTTGELYAHALATIPPNEAPGIAWRMMVGMSVVAFAAVILTVQLFFHRVARLFGAQR